MGRMLSARPSGVSDQSREQRVNIRNQRTHDNYKRVSKGLRKTTEEREPNTDVAQPSSALLYPHLPCEGLRR